MAMGGLAPASRILWPPHRHLSLPGPPRLFLSLFLSRPILVLPSIPPPPPSALRKTAPMSDNSTDSGSSPDLSDILPPYLNLPPHLSAQKYFFVCTLTVAAWDTLVLSPRTWRLLRTKEWPPLKILFHFLRLFMPIEFTIVGQYPSIQASVSFTHCSSFRCCIL